MTIVNSVDYHDYVIKNGKLICEFDQMYKNAKGVPCHQDKDIERLDCKIVPHIMYFRPFIQEYVVNYLEDNKKNSVNDNWVYMFRGKMV